MKQITPEMIEKAINNCWSEEDAKRGYTIVPSCECENGVSHIEKIDEMGVFDSDDEAAKQAEKDGILIIHDIILPPSARANYIDTPENRELLEPIANEWKRKIIQYCLNQGTGILYEFEPNITERGCTTPLELESAHASKKKARYVEIAAIDSFLYHNHPNQVEYAVEHNIDLIDFDEWQALQTVLFANTANPNDEISYETAISINSALWNEEITPLELTSPNPYTQTDWTELTKELLDNTIEKLETAIHSTKEIRYSGIMCKIGNMSDISSLNIREIIKSAVQNTNIKNELDSGQCFEMYLLAPVVSFDKIPLIHMYKNSNGVISKRACISTLNSLGLNGEQDSKS